MATTFQQVPLWSQVEFVADKAPARDFRVSLEDIKSGTGHLIAGELANYDADGIPFEQGDILFGKLRPYLAKFYHAPQPGTAGGDIHVYRPLPHAHPRFIYYVVSSGSFVGHASVSTTGVKMPRTDWAALRRFPVPLPPRDTQRAIADYLDRETSEIDAMLDKLNGLGRLLEERRHNEIALRVSDQEGRFPRVAVQTLGQINSGDVIPADRISEEGTYPVYGGNGLRGYTEDSNQTEPKLLIGRQGALCGNVHLAEGQYWASEHAMVVTPNIEFRPRWLLYVLQNEKLGQLSTAAAQPGITATAVGLQKIPFPPLVEQERIARHLDETTARIDAMLAKTQELKDLLTERRSALITAAVTGQIEVH